MKNEKNNDLEAQDDLTLEETIEQLAGCNFTVSEMALYLSDVFPDKKDFIKQTNEPDTAIWEAIQRGKLRSEFNVSNNMRRLAEAGNVTAVQQFEKIRNKKELQDLKNRIFFG